MKIAVYTIALNEIRNVERYLAACADADTIVVADTGSTDGTAQLWDLTTSPPAGSPLTGHTGPVTSVAFSPDGKTLASGSNNCTIKLWEVATRKELATIESRPGYVLWQVHSVAFSLDGKTLAAGTRVGTIHLWDVSPAK